MAKVTLQDASSGYLSTSIYNQNNSQIENAMENTLSRDGTAPNFMEAELDMNSYKIRNVQAGSNAGDAVNFQQLSDAIIGGGGGLGLQNIVEDLSPQLGAPLDTNGQAIVSTSNADIDITPDGSGNINLNSSVDMAGQFIESASLQAFRMPTGLATPTSGTVTFNYNNGNTFHLDLSSATGAITVNISAVPTAGQYAGVQIFVTQNASTAQTVSWTPTILWAGGSEHVVTTTLSGRTIWTLETIDGGTTWFGSGADYS